MGENSKLEILLASMEVMFMRHFKVEGYGAREGSHFLYFSSDDRSMRFFIASRGHFPRGHITKSGINSHCRYSKKNGMSYLNVYRKFVSATLVYE